MKMTMTVAAAALTLFAVGQASAQGPMAKVREACAADMQKFCPDKTGKDRHDCMMANKDKLSDSCKTAAAEAMKAHEAMEANKPK